MREDLKHQQLRRIEYLKALAQYRTLLSAWRQDMPASVQSRSNTVWAQIKRRLLVIIHGERL